MLSSTLDRHFWQYIPMGALRHQVDSSDSWIYTYTFLPYQNNNCMTLMLISIKSSLLLRLNLRSIVPRWNSWILSHSLHYIWFVFAAISSANTFGMTNGEYPILLSPESANWISWVCTKEKDDLLYLLNMFLELWLAQIVIRVVIGTHWHGRSVQFTTFSTTPNEIHNALMNNGSASSTVCNRYGHGYFSGDLAVISCCCMPEIFEM